MVKGSGSVGNDGERSISANGSVSYRGKNGAEVTMERPVLGTFPNVGQLIPEYTHNGSHEYVIGLDAKQLYELAQALGDSLVELRFGPPLRPIGVRPLSGNGARGLLMPVRVKGE